MELKDISHITDTVFIVIHVIFHISFFKKMLVDQTCWMTDSLCLFHQLSYRSSPKKLMRADWGRWRRTPRNESESKGASFEAMETRSQKDQFYGYVPTVFKINALGSQTRWQEYAYSEGNNLTPQLERFRGNHESQRHFWAECNHYDRSQSLI